MEKHSLSPEAYAGELSSEKELAHLLSHDVGTPLRAVVEFSSLLATSAKEKLNEEERLFLSLITENGQHMQQMLQALVKWLRILHEHEPLELIDSNCLLERILSPFQERLLQIGATLIRSPLPPVVGEDHLIFQLFSILVDNAITYRSLEWPLVLRISAEILPDGRQARFIFSDNGIGIAENYHSRIFEPLRRLHTQQEYSGVGMGLAIARRIVEKHAGKLGVHSSATRGSEFYFILPTGE